jgi:ABC-type phosphate transport system substrate-binding protein
MSAKDDILSHGISIFYTVNPPEGDVKKFVDWVTGREGQRTVKQNGYVPLYETE